MAEPRRTFLPVVLVGLASAGLCAVVGHQSWAHVTGTRSSRTTGLSSTLTVAAEAGRVPGCTALALVLLACWGVVLVTRGRVRRVVTWLALLAAVGATVAAVLGYGNAPDEVSRAYADFGMDVRVTRTAWSFVVFPIALLALVSAVAAVRLAPTWPEMGRRYDAPGSAGPTRTVPVGEEQDDVTVWKAISEGRDPTATPEP